MSLNSHEAAHERFLKLASRISYPGLVIEVEHEEIQTGVRPSGHYKGEPSPILHHSGHYLRVSCPHGRCNVTGEPMPWKGRKWRLSQHMTDTEVVATAFKAILTALEHEAREAFKVDGVTIFNSHLDLDKLIQYHRENDPHGRAPAPTS